MKALLLVFFLISNSVYAQVTTYFSGEDVMKSPDGSIVYSSNPKLIKRIVDQTKNKIEEEVVIKAYQGDFEVKNIDILVSGSTFTVTAGSLTGSGNFYGVPWAWTGWSSEFEFPDKSKVRVFDYLGSKELNAVSEYYDSTGKLISVTFSKLKKVTKSTYETLKAKLLKK